MSDLGLVLANLGRKKVRTFLLVFTTMVGFLVFGGLSGFQDTINAQFDEIPADQIVTNNAINFTVSLPLAYVQRVRALDRVERATYQSWFGGYIQEARNTVGAFAVDPETYVAMFGEELGVDSETAARFFARRDALLIPQSISEEYGWEVGDAVTMFSNIFTRDGGSNAWPFVVGGVYPEGDSGFPTVLLHFEYFNEGKSFGRDRVGSIIADVTSADVVDDVANEIDDLFFNSPAQTETILRSSFARGFLEQSISIGFIVTVISTGGFASILLVVGNSMVVAIRERTREIAVMKTLGFQAGRIFRLVLAESVSIVALGGALGLGLTVLAFIVLNGGDLPFPELQLSTTTIAVGAAIMLGMGLLTGFIPAWNAQRLNVVTALGRE